MLKVERETSIYRIYLVMTDPEMWHRIKRDDSILENIEIDTEALYYTVLDDEEVIGIAYFEPVDDLIVKYHPMVLKQHRSKYSREFHKLVINALRSEFGHTEVIGETPSCFKDVLLAARRFGFREVGRIRNGINLYGKTHDVVITQYEK